SGQSQLYASDRVKSNSLMVQNIPYALVYEYVIRQKQTLGLPSWRPDYSTDVSIEKSSFQVVTAPDVALRINERNLVSPAVIKKEPETTSYTWSVENIRAERSEPFSPSRRLTGILVEVIPQHVQYYIYIGAYSYW